MIARQVGPQYENKTTVATTVPFSGGGLKLPLSLMSNRGYTTSMSTTKSKYTTPRSLQKLFFIGLGAWYAMTLLDMAIQAMRSNGGGWDVFFPQMLILFAPLVAFVIVYFTRKRRDLSLATLFETSVAAFAIILLLVAISGVLNYIPTDWFGGGAADLQTAHQQVALMQVMYYCVQFIAFGGAIAVFVFSIWGARKRGEW